MKERFSRERSTATNLWTWIMRNIIVMSLDPKLKKNWKILGRFRGVKAQNFLKVDFISTIVSGMWKFLPCATVK